MLQPGRLGLLMTIGVSTRREMRGVSALQAAWLTDQGVSFLVLHQLQPAHAFPPLNKSPFLMQA